MTTGSGAISTANQPSTLSPVESDSDSLDGAEIPDPQSPDVPVAVVILDDPGTANIPVPPLNPVVPAVVERPKKKRKSTLTDSLNSLNDTWREGLKPKRGFRSLAVEIIMNAYAQRENFTDEDIADSLDILVDEGKAEIFVGMGNTPSRNIWLKRQILEILFIDFYSFNTRA